MIGIDIELPESCVTCRFSQGDYGFCHAMPENFCGYVNEFEEQGRPEWCPLVQVDKLMIERIISQDELLSHDTRSIVDYIKFEATRMMCKEIINNHILWEDKTDRDYELGNVRIRGTAFAVNNHITVGE